MFSRPATLDDALVVLSDADTVVLSGGTDFYPQRLNQKTVGRSPEHVVDISALSELRGIAETGEGWRIGAATTWSDLATADLPSSFDGLRCAARQVGGTQIQNVATIAGNLCTASPAADGVPALLTLDAVVELQSLTGIRTVALDEFITGYRSTALRQGELVTAITIPDAFHSESLDARTSCVSSGDSTHADSSVYSSFVKLGSRAYLVISIAMVATLIVLDGETITRARIAVGACSPVATRLPAVEAALVGARFEEAALDSAVRSVPLDLLAPIDDMRATGEYRRLVVPRLIVDALHACRTSVAMATGGTGTAGTGVRR